jgi:hypothetical protein
MNRKRWLIVVILGILVGLLTAYFWSQRVAFNHKIVELKTKGLPTSIDDLEKLYKLPAGTPNAADIYLKAFAIFHELSDPEKQKLLPMLGERPIPEDNEPFSPDQMAAAAEFVTLNQEMFTLLHEAGKVEHCAYPVENSQNYFTLRSDDIIGIRIAAYSLCTATIYYIDTNQATKAYECLKDGIRLGNSLRHNNLSVNYYLQEEVLSVNIQNISRWLNHIKFSDEQLLELQTMLDGADQMLKFSSAVKIDLCFFIEWGRNPSNVPLGITTDTLSRHAIGFYLKNIIKQIEIEEQVIEIEQEPINKQLASIKKVKNEIDKLSSFYSLTKRSSSAFDKRCQAHLQIKSYIQCVITALAIERYRLKANRLPGTIGDLVPEYLKEIYLDPFDSKPLRYKQVNPGYVIYNIGIDCVDNGGKKNLHDHSYDETFRIYR